MAGRAVRLVAVAAGVVALGGLAALPEAPPRAANVVTRPEPATMPTASSAPPPPAPVDIRTLIIMQNPSCWTGIPGQTCKVGTPTYAWHDGPNTARPSTTKEAPR